jgi:hypothetical protein
VQEPVVVDHGPHLGRALPDPEVDAAHVHRLIVDLVPAEGERTLFGGLGRIQVRRGAHHRGDRGPAGQRRRGPELDEVEPVLEAVEPTQHPAVLRRVRAEFDGLTGSEGDHDLGALARREVQPVGLPGLGQEPAVGADEREPPVVGEPEVVEPGVGAVEEPQPHQFGRDLEVAAHRAVDEEVAAGHPELRDEPGGVVEPVVPVERPVLDDERHVVDAVCPRQRQCVRFVVVDDEHPGRALVDVLGGLPVRMRVVPERRRSLVHGPLRRPGLPGCDHLVRPAVHHGGQVHAVPVDRGRLVEAVPDRERDRLAPPRPNGRAE